MKKIILTIIALSLLCITILIDKYVITEDIIIYIEIVKDDVKKEETIIIEEGNTFIKKLNNEFELEIENGFIYKIDFLEAYDNTYAYISILINGEYSGYGINNLKLNDKDKVSFVYTLI